MDCVTKRHSAAMVVGYQVMAWKSAVKAGQRLHPEAIARLLTQLFECEMPYTCAHGRPTVISYGLGELEKLFRRK